MTCIIFLLILVALNIINYIVNGHIIALIVAIILVAIIGSRLIWSKHGWTCLKKCRSKKTESE